MTVLSPQRCWRGMAFVLLMLSLLGAAQVSAKLGQNAKAVAYYKRLLEVDPGNGAARSFVDKHGSSADSTSERPRVSGEVSSTRGCSSVMLFPATMLSIVPVARKVPASEA